MPMMREVKKRPSYQAVTLAEYRLLNALARNSAHRSDPRVSEELFPDEQAKSAYAAIMQLHEQNVRITPASFLQAAESIDFNLNQNVIQSIWNIDDGETNTLDDMVEALQAEVLKSKVLEITSSIKDGASCAGELDKDAILDTVYTLEEHIQTSGKDLSELKDLDRMIDEYKEDLAERKEGKFHTFGDPLLDKEFYRGAGPGQITIVAAGTSMGKSTFVLHLNDGLIEKDVPALYVSNEMGAIDTMDRWIASRCGIRGQDMYDVDTVDAVSEQVDEVRANLGHRGKFYFCEAPGITLSRLKSIIREFKHKARSDYGLVTIDLLSGIDGFMVGNKGANTANIIESNMNRLEAIAKEENVHIIGVVQLKRGDNLKVSSVEDIKKLRPTQDEIKNSGAYLEKSTNTLALFRPVYFAQRYLPEDEEAQMMDDVMEVQVLKSRNGEPGNILKYKFDGEYFRVLPFTKDEMMTEQEKAQARLANMDLGF